MVNSLTAEAKRKYGRTLLRQYAAQSPKNTLIYRSLKNLLGPESLIGKQQIAPSEKTAQHDGKKHEQTTVEMMLKHSKDLPPIKWGQEQRIQLGYDEVDACVEVFPDRKVLWMFPVPAGNSDKEQIIRETFAGDKQVVLRGIAYYVFSDEGGFAGACKAYRLGNVLNMMAVPQTDYSFVGKVSELSVSGLSFQSTRELQLKEIIPIKMEHKAETELLPLCRIKFYKGVNGLPDLLVIRYFFSRSYELIRVVDKPGKGKVLAKNTRLGFVTDDGYRYILERDHNGAIEAQIEKSVTGPKTAIGGKMPSKLRNDWFYPISKEQWVADIGQGYTLFLRGLASPQKNKEEKIVSGKFMYIIRKADAPHYERNIDLEFKPGKTDGIILNLDDKVNICITASMHGTRIQVG